MKAHEKVKRELERCGSTEPCGIVWEGGRLYDDYAGVNITASEALKILASIPDSAGDDEIWSVFAAAGYQCK